MTRIYIITDLEGISGVHDISQIMDSKSQGHFDACERLIADTNAAIRGAFDGGADEVYVTDGHGGGGNMEKAKSKLDSRAKLIKIFDMDLSAVKTDAFMHVGAHAMMGTQCAFLDHTRSSKTVFEYRFNGRPAGELGMAGMWAGAYDIPYIFVSGDRAACDEARAFFGDVKTASVKYSIERNTANCIPLDEAESLIYKQAKDSISLIGSGRIRPYKVGLPMEVTLEFIRSDYADSAYAVRTGVDRLDARTIRKIVPKIETYRDITI